MQRGKLNENSLRVMHLSRRIDLNKYMIEMVWIQYAQIIKIKIATNDNRKIHRTLDKDLCAMHPTACT